MKKREIAGFTLIEAMVLVAVLGILAAIGIPNYSRYVTRGHLADAGNVLAEYRVRMEQFYKDNDSTYSKAGACGETAPTNLDNFAISCVVATGGHAFTATATGSGSTAGFVYTINHANVRATAAIPSHWGSLTLEARNTWVTR
jgi:type IV pilus assembly protein PilE